MKSNKVAFTDICDLIAETKVTDSGGHYTITETKKRVFCSIINGIARTEYYEAQKAGYQLSATAEIWEFEYNNERILEHNSKRYTIERTYPTGRKTIELSLKEVER